MSQRLLAVAAELHETVAVLASQCIPLDTFQKHTCDYEGLPPCLPGNNMGLAVGAGLLNVCACCVAQQLLLLRCLVKQADTYSSCHHMSAGFSPIKSARLFGLNLKPSLY